MIILEKGQIVLVFSDSDLFSWYTLQLFLIVRFQKERKQALLSNRVWQTDFLFKVLVFLLQRNIFVSFFLAIAIEYLMRQSA